MFKLFGAPIVTNAEAIHPGFGFLSENSQFASMCEECNITFIGPKAETIDAMGNKINARQLMQKAKVPVIPGSDGVIDSVEEALTIAEEIGYPVMLKALVVAEKESEKFFQKKSYRNTLLQRKKPKPHLVMMICI